MTCEKCEEINRLFQEAIKERDSTRHLVILMLCIGARDSFSAQEKVDAIAGLVAAHPLFGGKRTGEEIKKEGE